MVDGCDEPGERKEPRNVVASLQALRKVTDYLRGAEGIRGDLPNLLYRLARAHLEAGFRKEVERARRCRTTLSLVGIRLGERTPESSVP
ncbi:MAG TPA: hypothetical protein DCL13_00645 [Peptococcaceae bacterium]|nr:hypothetical protein [Peptococcaceae bacterium]